MHQKQWEFLKKKFELNQLGHAYLFSGAKGAGKKDFAQKFVRFIGCKFPDLMVVESDGEEIPIAKIREIQNFLSYKSYYGGFRAVIVNNAERMNQEAQSCFLKTLEEPKGSTVLILISSRPDMILPTIFSRCQLVKFLGRLAEDKKSAEEEAKITESFLKIMPRDFAEKFRYAKDLDLDRNKLAKILEALQKHFRKQLLNDFSDKKTRKILEILEEISQKLLFANINPRLALEILLMNI